MNPVTLLLFALAPKTLLPRVLGAGGNLVTVIPGMSLALLALAELHDGGRVLVNQHKGWYTRLPDNQLGLYKIGRDANLAELAGMDDLHIRQAWAYLEPKGGRV